MIEFFIAFGAGLISFLSPCVLPLIPGYISYISGSSINELLEKKNVNLIPIILFTVGFSLVFIIFGAASTFIGQVLLKNSFLTNDISNINHKYNESKKYINYFLNDTNISSKNI